ncbi:hypothetical protein B9Z55_018594 [Caenorhabditis nigoni]|uniref:Uncharacterized protein n=1 Tax=Caenorhabditis nigoni TaxID=1611254 RepID=A0A2G5TEX2_9PELO|nr:hypothetical protein B9Z55_018594 [Caenorhabditis nigoni]
MDGHDHPPWEDEGSLPSIQAEQFHDDSGRVSNILEFQPSGFPAGVLTFAEFTQMLEDNWNSSQGAENQKGLQTNIPLNARSPTKHLSNFSTEDGRTSPNNGIPDVADDDDSYFEVPPHLKTTLLECVRQDSDDQKLPRIYGDLKKYLSKFVNIEVDIYATRRVAINRILAKIKDKIGLELDKRLINFLLGNLKRNYHMRFKHTNKSIFEGLNWDFTSFDARFPVFSGEKTIFDKWD